MKLAELVKEESIGDVVARWTPKRMNEEQIIEWCEENASAFMKNGKAIFRGTFDDLTGLLDTRGLKRSSANSYNYYNLWIDNHPTWIGYPKRSQSLICSTDFDSAENFGSVYLIIPKDNTPIGVCPEHDMWGSFNDISHIMPNGDLNDFMHVMRAALPTGGTFNTWAELTRALKRTTIEWSGKTNSLKNFMVDTDCENLWDLFEEVFDPESNSFTLSNSSNFSGLPNREVWVSGDIMQIELHQTSDALMDYFRAHFGKVI